MTGDKENVGKADGMCFETLECYQKALLLYSAAYRMANVLPEIEKFNLASQIRRASLSTLLNIAEGYGRYHYLDKLKFFFIARGSLYETYCAFIAAHTAGYIDDEKLAWIRTTETETEKALNGYINFIRKQQLGQKEYGDKYIHEEQAIYSVRIEDIIPGD